ncbi:hypothetical protein BOW40_12595 [Solemya velum gill symbiont]|nr:hypothetical protein BOW40_12595 [Solemya velum gill symbiont]
MEFLAHIVGGGRIEPTQDKIQGIRDFPIPTSKKQVRSFLGMIGFYRKFIPNFAETAASLFDLTSKRSGKIVWGQDQSEAFEKLKKCISSSPVLRNADLSKSFVLQTDASDRGVSGVLLQEFSDGRHPIMFVSKKLLPREQNYSVIEKECYASKSFVIETDHCPLKWLNTMKTQNQRLLRWSLVLQEFQFLVKHISGKENVQADALSRIYCDN